MSITKIFYKNWPKSIIIFNKDTGKHYRAFVDNDYNGETLSSCHYWFGDKSFLRIEISFNCAKFFVSGIDGMPRENMAYYHKNLVIIKDSIKGDECIDIVEIRKS